MPSELPCFLVTVQRTSCPTRNSSASFGTAAAAPAAVRRAAADPAADPAAVTAASAAAAAVSALATSSAMTSDACRARTRLSSSRSCASKPGLTFYIIHILSLLCWPCTCFLRQTAKKAEHSTPKQRRSAQPSWRARGRHPQRSRGLLSTGGGGEQQSSKEHSSTEERGLYAAPGL